jgi:RND family efflux transporter MFP subunit
MSASRSERLLRIAAWALPILVLASCSGDEAPELPPVIRPIKTLVVGGEAEGEFNFPGTVQGAKRSVLSFRVPGQLIELPINEGDSVPRGRLLARLDPSNFEIAVAEAKATLDKAVADHQRYQRLYEREAVPLADVEFYRAQREVAKARYEQARLDLGYTFLKAPYSGYIGRKYVENFEDVQAKEPVLTLQNVNLVEIVVDVPETIMARADGEGVQFTQVARFDSLPDREFPLELKETAAEADEATRTYRVTFSMPQPEEILVLSGMTARVTIRGAMRRGSGAIRIPSMAAFAGEGGKSVVWVVDTSTMTVTRRVVQLGEVAGTRDVWIESGLQAGETIAVTAVQELVEGDEIRPLPQTY